MEATSRESKSGAVGSRSPCWISSVSGSGVPVHDVTIARNLFYRDPARFYGGPSATIDYYEPLRQLLELKSGIRFDINGNVL